LAAQVARANDAARKQAEFDSEQQRLREGERLQRESAAQYPAFVSFAKRLRKTGMSEGDVQAQLELRGLAQDLAARAAREASNG
jgi:polyisoprenoid-binding protein YceI